MTNYDYEFEEPIEILAVLNKGQYNPDKGQITPIAFVENESKYTPIYDPLEEFPNSGNVWVSSEYTLLTNSFKSNEVFKIKAYKDEKEDYKNSQTRDKYWTKGSKAIKLDRIKLYPILEIDELPTSSKPHLPDDIQCEFPFFLNTLEGRMYGPFSLSTDEHGKQRVIALEAMRSAPLGLSPEYIYSVDFSEVQVSGLLENFIINDENCMFINNAESKLQLQGWEQIDFISDEKLLNWGLRCLLPKENIRSSKKEIDKWKSALQNINSFEGDDETRRTRLLDLIEKIENLDNNWEPLIKQAILQNKKLVEDYIKRNEDTLVDKSISPLRERYEQERDKLETAISSLRSQKETFDSDVDKLKKQKKELDNLQAKQAKEALEKEETSLVQRIEQLKDNLAELSKRNAFAQELDQLEKEVNDKREQRRSIETEISTLQNHDLPRALTKLKTELAVLHGNYGNNCTQSHSTCSECNLRDFAPSDRKNYVRDMQEYLEDSCGRVFENDEVANFLISYQNSFLTVFAGAPGSGKTSTVRFLALALGLREFFLPVKVARGWASQRDLLGYFNPINSTFQEARTGIYSLLRQISNSENSDLPLTQVLLDEANLSPMEHYWADFLSMCDCQSNDFRTINVGSNDPSENITVSDNLRFVATINNDNTTEKLSPRLLDRSTIIRLPEFDISESAYVSHNPTPHPLEAISYENFAKMFDATAICNEVTNGDQISFSSLEFDKLKRITSILSEGESVGQRIILSPRKINSVRSYCFAARNIFDDPNNALDFALAQQVLPVIEGFGEGFGDKLKRLRDEVSRLPRTKAKLQEILSKGQANHHSYSFFV